MNVSIRLKDDLEVDKTFGWVLKMYFYSISSTLHGVQHVLWKEFMIHRLGFLVRRIHKATSKREKSKPPLMIMDQDFWWKKYF
jgi:hypothetical protein